MRLTIQQIMPLAKLGRVAILNQIKSEQLKATLNTSGVTPYWEATQEDVDAWLLSRRKRGRPKKVQS